MTFGLIDIFFAGVVVLDTFTGKADQILKNLKGLQIVVPYKFVPVQEGEPHPLKEIVATLNSRDIEPVILT